MSKRPVETRQAKTCQGAIPIDLLHACASPLNFYKAVHAGRIVQVHPYIHICPLCHLSWSSLLRTCSQTILSKHGHYLRNP